MLLKSIGVFLSIVAGLVSWNVYNLTTPPDFPEIDFPYRRIQGKEPSKAITPFKINVSNEVLEDLNTRLSSPRQFIQPLDNVAFQYGFNTNYLKKVIEFWRTKYDWRKQEKFLNSLPQFKTYIGSLQVHFIHVKPKQTKLKVRPILLLHGWPGSIREFYDLIPILTTPQPNRDFVFEVIAPSLPGYGFSEAPHEKGYSPAVFSAMFVDLMNKLGHKKFYVQGGDWGAIIADYMATLYPKSLLGLHSNMCYANTLISNLKTLLGSFWPQYLLEEKFIYKVYPLSKMYSFLLEETGYFHIQATKPDTVGVALNDSPVGLAAYILEKFSTWTNRKNKENFDGNLEEKFTLTALLDNIMIYWVTGTITTSMRLYSEQFASSSPSYVLDRIPQYVPSACARFPEELAFVPELVLEEKYKNLTRLSDLPRGGHFAAFEEPKIMAEDIYESINLIEKRYYKNL